MSEGKALLLDPSHIQLRIFLLLVPRYLSQAGLPGPRSSKVVSAPLSSWSFVTQGLSSEQDFLTPVLANGSLCLEHRHVLTGW